MLFWTPSLFIPQACWLATCLTRMGLQVLQDCCPLSRVDRTLSAGVASQMSQHHSCTVVNSAEQTAPNKLKDCKKKTGAVILLCVILGFNTNRIDL